MSTWSRPYVTITDQSGAQVGWTCPSPVPPAAPAPTPAAVGLPPAARVQLRWRTPRHPNACRRTFSTDDPTAAALLAGLLAAHAARGAGFVAEADGWPRALPEAPVAVRQPVTPAAAAGPSAVPEPPTTQLAPVLGERLIVSPQNRTLREVRDGVLTLGSTVAKVAEAIRQERSWGGAHDTNMSNVLDFITQVLVYGEPIQDADQDPDDPPEVAAWKQARLDLPGVEVGASVHVLLLLAPDLEHAIRVRRRTDRRVERLNEQAARRYEQAWDRYNAALRLHRSGTRGGGRMPAKPPEQLMLRPIPLQCSARTEELFGTGIGMLLHYAATHGLLVGPDPWPAFSAVGNTKAGYRRSTTLRPHQRNVPAVGAVQDLADAVAQLGPLDRRTGRPVGERFRAPILAGLSGARPSELDALRPDEYTRPPGGLAQLTFSRTLVLTHRLAPLDPAADPEGLTTSARFVNHLKDRPAGEVRPTPLPSAVADAIDAHMAAGYASNTLLFTGPEGGVIRWGNLADTYWHPAVRKVFGRSTEAALREMGRAWLRKAAITWMLRAGLRPDEVAALTGHDVVVLYQHYAGVVKDTRSHRPWTGWDDAWAWAVQEHDVP